MRAIQTLSLLVLISTVPSGFAQAEETAPVALWQGLETGMTPEQTVPIITAVGGVKRVRPMAERRSEPGKRLDIDYVSGRIPIADMGFELEPRFEKGHLSQLFLIAKNQCASNFAKISGALTSGLRAKYEPLRESPKEITEVDVLEAQQTSRSTGEAVSLFLGYGASDLVVALHFRVKVEAPPPYPSGAGNFVYNLWKLLRSQYDKRKAECGGSGDERMDVILHYIPRPLYAASMSEAQDKDRAKKDALANQL